jgi:hypothetical protein
MSTHTNTDQSGTYIYEIDGDTFTVMYDGMTEIATLSEITDPDYIEWMSVADDLVQWVDDGFGFIDGEQQIAYAGKFYNLAWA